MDFGLRGKTAIVTGAAGGIGSAIARDFAQEGVNLSLSYHQKACTDLMEEIQRFGVEAMTVHADICNAKDIEALVQSTYDRFGRIEILVNNAGVGLLGSVEDTTEEDWDRMMALNLKSVFLLSKAVLKYMK
jgi:NAD(P)-dependent dehydrogenase (short-subunit alcohol dehydrogenase family)